MDRDYLVDDALFHSPGVRMDGPIRHPDNSVEVIEFYGRLSRKESGILLPYHAKRSPLHLRIRSHRFGLQGTVKLTVNGEEIDDFVFGPTSYPWGGLRAVLPQAVAERGPLRIGLQTSGGVPSPEHLPEDIGLGIDWIEVEPMSQGVRVMPTWRAWISFYAFVAMAGLFMHTTGASSSTSLLAMLLAGCGLSALGYAFPVPVGMACGRLWTVFLIGAVVHHCLRWLVARAWLPSAEPNELAFVSRLFVAAALLHSALIFFPNHAPPDVPLHGIQVSWLDNLDVSVESLSLYSQLVSRGITEDAVTMEIGRDATREDLKELLGSRSDAGYATPYPPFFYLTTYALSRPWDDIRFMLEFFPAILGALIVALTYFIARAIWSDVLIAKMSAILMCLEISLWHHVHRGHGPGVFGALFVVAFTCFLVVHVDALRTRRGVLLFGVLTTICLLSYTVTLVQLSIWTTVLIALLFVAGSEERALAGRVAVGFALGGCLALAVFYGPYVVSALTSGGVLLDRAEAYEPPAELFFLRNQLRDGVRLLRNGYPVYLLLSAVGLWMLGRSDARRHHKMMLWAAVSTYVALLILKDPDVMPRVFLHAKEHLFYAPFACLLGAVPLAALWRTKRLRAVVVAILLALSALAVHDQSWNANTLESQPLARILVDVQRANA